MTCAETDLLASRNLAATSIGDVAEKCRRARTSIGDGASATIREVSAHTNLKMGRAIDGAIGGAIGGAIALEHNFWDPRSRARYTTFQRQRIAHALSP